jgi:uncharacterized protein (DUF305 family)
MSDSRPGTPNNPPSPRRHAVVAIMLVSIAPVAVGTATMATGMSAIPFGLTVMIFIVVWVAALFHHHTAVIVATMEDLSKGERGEVKKLRKEIEKEGRMRVISELAASVERLDQRGPGRRNLRSL